jgi:hypothetical protein
MREYRNFQSSMLYGIGQVYLLSEKWCPLARNSKLKDQAIRGLTMKRISAVATNRNEIFEELKLSSIGSNHSLKIIDNGRDATYCCANQFARPAIQTGFKEP